MVTYNSGRLRCQLYAKLWFFEPVRGSGSLGPTVVWICTSTMPMGHGSRRGLICARPQNHIFDRPLYSVSIRLVIALRHSARRAANQTWISPSSSMRSSPVVSFAPSFLTFGLSCQSSRRPLKAVLTRRPVQSLLSVPSELPREMGMDCIAF